MFNEQLTDALTSKPAIRPSSEPVKHKSSKPVSYHLTDPVKHKRSFSLVELMVVIAIIGILSAIAVPSYKVYVIKSQLAAGLPVAEAALKVATQNYDTGNDFPSSLTVYGVTIPAGSWAAISAPPVIGMHYNFGAGTGKALICIFYSDIGIPGFVSNNHNTSGNNRVCMTSTHVNGLWTYQCGTWDNGDFPDKYLPSGCNCKQVDYGNVSC